MHSYPVVVKDVIETESDIQMYGIDGAGPAPSLYTKYYMESQ